MSAAGEVKDARASRAKPRLEERVCEHGWRPTLDVTTGAVLPRRAHRRARRRAIAHTADKMMLDDPMLVDEAA
jgi:hypothetical protein